MDDLVSRRAAIDAMNEVYCHIEMIKKRPVNKTEQAVYLDMIGAVKSVPSAQPEIIYCGECKWFQCNVRMDGYLPNGVDEFECRHWCGSCDPVDFCSYAERRTGE